MNLEFIIRELNIAENILAVILGLPRLYMIIQTAPFMGASVVTGTLRIAIALAFYSVLHPVVLHDLQSHQLTGFLAGMTGYALIIFKETLIGALLGLLIGMLFWALQGTGFFIDNQRGANQAAEIDPLSGDQTSPYGSLFFQCVIIVFFMTGGFTLVLQAIYNSYVYWPVASFLPTNILFNDNFPLFFAKQVSNVMLLITLFSGPIIVACLLTDFSLGLINRFASQLNVYILAMPIKSFISSFLAIFYLAILLKYVQPMFKDIVFMLQNVQSFM